MSTDALHTWTLDKSSFLIRLYSHLYGAPEGALSFCSLFWGTLLSPLVAIVLGLGRLGTKAFQLLPEKKEPTLEEIRAARARRSARRSARTRRANAIRDFFSGLADGIVAFFQRHSLVSKALKVIGIGVLGLAVLGLLGFLIASFVLYPIALAWLGGVILAIALSVFVSLFLSDHSDTVKSFFVKIGRAFRFVGRFLATGYHAIKYRTCPKVEIQ
jgi:small-conductance mechanosensitive channel